MKNVKWCLKLKSEKWKLWNSATSLDPCSDFLVPDYLSQVQEEEEALGVQYELEESQHHPVYPGSTPTATAASSSSSVQMPVISQVSSSTQNCESSSGFLSPEPLDPPETPASLKMDGDETAAATEEAKTDGSTGGGSPEVFGKDKQQHAQAQEVAPITIQWFQSSTHLSCLMLLSCHMGISAGTVWWLRKMPGWVQHTSSCQNINSFTTETSISFVMFFYTREALTWFNIYTIFWVWNHHYNMEM